MTRWTWIGGLALLLMLAACNDALGPTPVEPLTPAPIAYRYESCELPGHNTGPACTRAMAQAGVATGTMVRACLTPSIACVVAAGAAGVAWYDWSQTRDAYGHRNIDDAGGAYSDNAPRQTDERDDTSWWYLRAGAQ